MTSQLSGPVQEKPGLSTLLEAALTSKLSAHASGEASGEREPLDTSLVLEKFGLRLDRRLAPSAVSDAIKGFYEDRGLAVSLVERAVITPIFGHTLYPGIASDRDDNTGCVRIKVSIRSRSHEALLIAIYQETVLSVIMLSVHSRPAS